MSFQDVVFGTTDADTELIRSPEIFDNAFFDPHDNIGELITGDKFIVCGRKGDGKSAYLAKLVRMAESDSNMETIPVSLERLNSKFFEKFTDYDLTGGKRYVPMWKCIILLELVKYLEKRNFQIQRPHYCSLVDALNRMGLLHGDSLEHTLTKLDSTDITISVSNWGTYGRRTERERIIRGPNDVYNVLSDELFDVYLDGVKFFMVFDGLDDILRNHDVKIEIITGLIRASNEINNSLHRRELKFKIIVLIRNDIFDMCRDPDFSKIKIASSINLSWVPGLEKYSSDLSELVFARFKMYNTFPTDFKSMWKYYFPDGIDGKDSFEYMLENTLYKPRDILMFFSIAQAVMKPHNHRLSEHEFKVVLRRYSEEYFISNMQDELTGFIPDEAINELQTVISRIGSRRFKYRDFEARIKENSAFIGVSAEDVLKCLFERGYIGQYRRRPEHPKEEFLFQTHINTREKYVKTDDCQIHRGLMRAFGV